jgi:hypothetical protein
LSLAVDGAPAIARRAGGVVWAPAGQTVRLEGGGPPGLGQRVDVDAVSLDVRRWFADLEVPTDLALAAVPGQSPLIPTTSSSVGARALLVTFRGPTVVGQEGVRVATSQPNDPSEQLLRSVLSLRASAPPLPRPLMIYEGPGEAVVGSAVRVPIDATIPDLRLALARVSFAAVDPTFGEAAARYWSNKPRPMTRVGCVGFEHPALAGEHTLARWERQVGQEALVAALLAVREKPGAGFDDLASALGPGFERGSP